MGRLIIVEYLKKMHEWHSLIQHMGIGAVAKTRILIQCKSSYNTANFKNNLYQINDNYDLLHTVMS